MNLGKCCKCNKTCYKLEGVTVGPPKNTLVFHKNCFFCENEGCTWKLTLTSYKYCDGKVWCKNHEPMRGFSNKAHQSGTISNNAQSISNAKNAPKISTHNSEVRGENMAINSQSVDMITRNAIKAPKQNVVNQQVRGQGMVSNSQSVDMITRNALKAPKQNVVNQQIRGSNLSNYGSEAIGIKNALSF
eukprot:TRINITY_DN1741_c1_g1_i1.p1 TRINITY_DN1741_c1_g1~~TRINITY_DN1741_c1_g1_i1.p1  ORF type:complete len:188 (-),score=40.71 TRINITY_DN1741_c1_g1_i1:98-661(-)